MYAILELEIAYIKTRTGRLLWESAAPPGQFFIPEYFELEPGVTRDQWYRYLSYCVVDFEGLKN